MGRLEQHLRATPPHALLFSFCLPIQLWREHGGEEEPSHTQGLCSITPSYGWGSSIECWQWFSETKAASPSWMRTHRALCLLLLQKVSHFFSTESIPLLFWQEKSCLTSPVSAYSGWLFWESKVPYRCFLSITAVSLLILPKAMDFSG